MRIFLAIVLLLTLPSSARADEAEAVELVDKALDTLSDTLPEVDPDSEEADLIAEAAALLDQAQNRLRQTPMLLPLPTRENPWWLLLDKGQPQRSQVKYRILDQPNVDGLSIRVRWDAIEPQRDNYQFGLIDSIVAQAKSRGKIYTLKVLAADNSPRWLDCQLHRDGRRTVQVPWCEDMANEYAQLQRELAARYANDPLLVMVHVSGFYAPAEMHEPKRQRWSNQIWIDAWNNRIDAVADAFPNQLVNLNQSPQPYVDDVVDHLYAKCGQERACVQMNALSAKTSMTWSSMTTLSDLDDTGGMVGFQYLCPSNAMPRFGGTFEQSVTKGTTIGARWYEFYQGDASKVP